LRIFGSYFFDWRTRKSVGSARSNPSPPLTPLTFPTFYPQTSQIKVKLQNDRAARDLWDVLEDFPSQAVLLNTHLLHCVLDIVGVTFPLGVDNFHLAQRRAVSPNVCLKLVKMHAELVREYG